MNIKNFELTPLKYLTREESEIALKWSVKSFTLEIESTNEFDNEALIVYKELKSIKSKCGYIKKYDYVFTDTANSLYKERRYILENNDWIETKETREIKEDKNWGKTEKVAIHTKEELKYLLNNFKDYKLLTNRFTDTWFLYLELQE